MKRIVDEFAARNAVVRAAAHAELGLDKQTKPVDCVGRTLAELENYMVAAISGSPTTVADLKEALASAVKALIVADATLRRRGPVFIRIVDLDALFEGLNNFNPGSGGYDA